MSDKETIYGVSLDQIEKLAKIIKDYNLEKIEITDKTVTIKGKNPPPPPPAMPSPMIASVQGAPVGDFAVPNRKTLIPEKEEASDAFGGTAKEEISGNVVKSPIVGTYYSCPAPGKPPFVEVGSRVKKGDVIMIIESMKLMNEVSSEFDGVVKKILVESGEPVEFDQTIMIIE